MTPDKRVEEIVEEYNEKFLLDVADTGIRLYCSRCSGSTEFETWLRTTLTQYHQDMMSEVVEKIEEKRKPETWTVMTTPVVSQENIAYNQALTEAQTIIKLSK